MKILQVSPFSYYAPSGVSEHVRNVSQRLAERHSVTVFATHHGTTLLPEDQPSTGRVNVENFSYIAPSDAYFFSPSMFFKLREAEFDIIQGHFYHALPIHSATLAKCKRFIATPHFHGAGHSHFRDFLLRICKPFGKRTLDRASKIVSVSQHERKLIINHFRCDSRKVVLIPNGVDFQSFREVKCSPHSEYKTILYVGCLRGYKGVQYLIEVMPRLDDNVRLEIVGIGPLRTYLEKRSHELGVQERIRFYEYLPRHKLIQKYANANVLVLLSRYEAYSLVVAEALTARLPCIVADTSALSEWIDNETCFGLSLPIRIGELAQLVEAVLKKSINKNSMKKWIGSKILDWNEVVQRLENIFCE